MKQAPYSLDPKCRAVVLDAVREICRRRGWNLLAAHVRTNHVHVVVESDIRPELVMNALKAYASRGLNRPPNERSDRKRWARHGSTRWLWNNRDVRGAIQYVVDGQGGSMAVFVAEDA